MFPLRDGVSASVIALPDPLPHQHWPTVLDFLVERFPRVPRAEIIRRMSTRDIFDATGNAVSPEAPYRAQQKLFYYRFVEDEPRVPFEETVLFQDELVVVADKPHFLSATPGGRYVQETLLVRLRKRLRIDSLAPMHRLDRETAGLMLFSVQPATRARYSALFAQRAVQKHYEALAATLLPMPTRRESRIVAAEHFMCMREAEGEPNALTEIECLETRGNWSRYCLQPQTGKKHQLRVHMAALGAPIVNDLIYPMLVSKEELERNDYSRPLQLLAKEIAFRDPISGEWREFSSARSLDWAQCGAAPR